MHVGTTLPGESKIPTRSSFYSSVYTSIDLYSICHRVYWDNMQHNNYWSAHLTYVMLLHYFGEKLVTEFEHLGRCFLW